ncbi:MAG: ATP-grasp domain-containing protein [Oscillospiraceae bacterium]|nr:ATP-grasp domain-containing protein [Oscillospiraceae bacterium]
MEFQEREFLPVILGGDITTYSLARSFHQAYGIRSLAISMVRSRLCADSVIIENKIVPDMDREETFLRTLTQIGQERGDKKLLLLACGDWYVRMIVEHRAQLEPYYIIPYIQEELLNRLVLKDSFYQICEEIGVPYPKTYVYDCQNPPDKLELPFSFPVIAKPASSAQYHYAQFPGKKKVFRLDTQEALDTVLDNLKTSSYDYKFLLQDFIPGDDTGMRILTCYCDRNSKVRFMSFGQTLLEDKGDMGIGNPVAIINRVNMEIMNHAKRLLEHVGYTGFANFDIKYDPRDQSYRFFEINTRLGRSNYYVTASGFNTVTWMVQDLIEQREFDQDLVIADNTDCIYTVVPKSILKKYIKDPALRREMLSLYARGKAVNPIDYKVETKLSRRIYPAIFLWKQRKKFKGKIS